MTEPHRSERRWEHGERVAVRMGASAAPLGGWPRVCRQRGASAAGVGHPTSCPALMVPHHWPRWSTQSALAVPPVYASSLLLTLSLTIFPSCPLPCSSTYI